MCALLAHRTKYFNNCLFHSVMSNFIVQTGDPTGTGKGGMSIYGCVAFAMHAARMQRWQ